MAKCSFKQVSKFFIPIYICIAFLPAFSAPRSVAELPDAFALVLGAQPDSVAPADSLTCPEEEDTLEMQELSLPQRLEKLLDNEIFLRTQVGLYVYDLTADSVVFAHNERQCMRPASCEKLVTAITALEELGGNHLFRTSFLATGETSDSLFIGNLCVRGGYDPLLDESDLDAFCDSLRRRGVRVIQNDIFLDLSFKDDKRLGWGWCWDDEAVPLTPLLFRNRDTFQSHLRQAFAKANIRWEGSFTERRVPSDAETLCERTHTIDQVLEPMMKKSDNSMAEALFYQLAHRQGGQGASRKHAVRLISRLVKRLDLDADHYQFADGSGLSLYNYVTPELLGCLLRHAHRHPAIFNHLKPSLPVAGIDGTLRKRMRGSAAEGKVFAKTGTVEGVSTLAGYALTSAGNLLAFVVMNQGIRHTSTGRNFQDRVCKTLVK